MTGSGEGRGAGAVHGPGGDDLQVLHSPGEPLEPVGEISRLAETPQGGVLGGDPLRLQHSKGRIHRVRFGRKWLKGGRTKRNKPTVPGGNQPARTRPYGPVCGESPNGFHRSSVIRGSDIIRPL